MSSYCLTLLDENKNVVWGMNPKDIMNSSSSHMMMSGNSTKGIYTTKTFNINVDGKTVGYVMVGQYHAVLLSEQDVNFKNSINKGIAISALLTILVVTIISLVVSKQFSKPIKKVSDTSVQLSKGDLEARSDIRSNIKEINSLIKSINMLGEKLKVQDLLRKRLVSDISHEIRTPLNVLQNNLEAMIDGILPVTVDRLNSLDEEVIRFGKLLNNLNSLKQFEAEEVKLNFESLSLKELLSQVCVDFSTLAKEKNVNIYFKSEDEQFTILGDIDKLKQVFINLISNSIKFSKQKGNVWVDLRHKEDKVMVEICDDGIGIKKEDLPYIFERLYRGDKSRQLTSGSGIGLTIAKRILDLHSASIEVESEENEGTKFTISFLK